MENTLKLYKDMVITHQETWGHIFALDNFGVIDTRPDLVNGANALFKISQKLRESLIADGVEVPHYDDINNEKD
ncbi:hypothetical protein SEA_ATUIN_227 [Arthrobacter phage Atuin]|nr:hypothetical protein SEA_ATUIN_26 [Arthrobacter phage Atuin]